MFITGYNQWVIDGRRVVDIRYDGSQGVSGQDRGTLCLFAGGEYSYAAHYWFWNTNIKQGKPDAQTYFGTYSEEQQGFRFSGEVNGFGLVVADTLDVGLDRFARSDQMAATCEKLR